MSTPDLRQMRYFTAVAERGSFTGAARELHVAQQAVSQQIKALEQTLGVTLLERSSRRVTLTPAGAVFLADCRRVLAGAERAARRAQAAARGEAGTLRLVYTLTGASTRCRSCSLVSTRTIRCSRSTRARSSAATSRISSTAAAAISRSLR